jgi:hypothetical protein
MDGWIPEFCVYDKVLFKKQVRTNTLTKLELLSAVIISNLSPKPSTTYTSYDS